MFQKLAVSLRFSLNVTKTGNGEWGEWESGNECAAVTRLIIDRAAKLPLGQVLNNVTCDVNTLRTAETFLHGKC